MVPTDGSQESEQAVPIAEQIARSQGAEALLVQVVEVPPARIGAYSGATAQIYQRYLAVLEEEAGANLNRLRAQFEERGIRVRTVLRRGVPADVLLDLEREQQVDLVVMATHGRSGLARFALGSIADRLVREGTEPVLVARDVQQAQSLATALLMLDGSELAEGAVPLVEALSGRPLKKVRLFSAVEGLVYQDAATSYLNKMSERLLAAGLQTEVVVEVGDPVELARRAALTVDLIVLCTHGRGGIDRFRHGSVADRVVREAGRPVLLVRAGTAEGPGKD
jgi:nucleotide-binding universal stress UspA family protein